MSEFQLKAQLIRVQSCHQTRPSHGHGSLFRAARGLRLRHSHVSGSPQAFQDQSCKQPVRLRLVAVRAVLPSFKCLCARIPGLPFLYHYERLLQPHWVAARTGFWEVSHHPPLEWLLLLPFWAVGHIPPLQREDYGSQGRHGPSSADLDHPHVQSHATDCV